MTDTGLAVSIATVGCPCCRLLDDNRELFVPELQETVRPHPHFMLFATQNPPGAYAGRKVLSRAFRGRFLELHVEELPDTELTDILHQRCGIAPSYAGKLVAVMRELQRRRQSSNVRSMRWSSCVLCVVLIAAMLQSRSCPSGCLVLAVMIAYPHYRSSVTIATVMVEFLNLSHAPKPYTTALGTLLYSLRCADFLMFTAYSHVHAQLLVLHVGCIHHLLSHIFC